MSDDVPFLRTNETPVESATLRTVVAWAFVLIPLLWGVTQTLIKSAALFQ